MNKKVSPLFICVVAFIALFWNMKTNEDSEKSYESSIKAMMSRYPESTLKDIYKSFFQDRLGPGHLVNDTNRVAQYLTRELQEGNFSSLWQVEPTGCDTNFYRVSLALVADSTIPEILLLNAFIRSANEHKPITIEEWRNEWNTIIQTIDKMDLSLPNYAEDKEEIQERLAQGKYIGHHSSQYRNAYSPHYRIISKEIYNTEIKPYVEKRKGISSP